MIQILIVDDSVFSQKITANLLKKTVQHSEVEIEFASDGEEGLKKYRELRPDYMFIDLLMPKLSGTDLIRTIKKEGGTGIFVVTADIQKSVRDEIEALGVLAFINKPLNEEKMRSLCDRMMGNDKNGSGMLSL